MQNDLASLSGAARLTLRVGGEAYPVHPLTLADLGELQAWVDSQYRDPVEIVREQLAGRKFSAAQEQFLLKTALEIACRPRALIGTPEADALIRSAAGQKRMLFLAIRKGRPEFGEADADALFAALTPAELLAVMVETGAEAVSADPKSPTSDGGPTTPPSDGPPSTGGPSTASA